MVTRKKPPVAPMDGATFRRLRKRLALSQAKLAQRMGVSVNTIYRWEADAVAIPPPVTVLVRLLVDQAKEVRS